MDKYDIRFNKNKRTYELTFLGNSDLRFRYKDYEDEYPKFELSNGSILQL